MFNENGIVHHLGLTQSGVIQEAFVAADSYMLNRVYFFSRSMLVQDDYL